MENRSPEELELSQAALKAEPDALEAEITRRMAEVRETHERVREFERLALAGTIAAGLGHDLGNLLLPLRLRLDALKRIDLPEEAKSDIAAIETAVNYLQQLSTGLRWLATDSGTGAGGVARTNLESWIVEAERVFKDALPPGITLETTIEPGLPFVRMSEAALTQAVYNLVQNAGQALKGQRGGKVEMEVSSGSQGFVVIAVSDNGPGLDEEILERCFEPFFSTRKRQISTGLGLAIVRSLVRRAGGDASVESKAGKGATFTITVPAVARETDATRHDTPTQAIVSVSGARAQALVRTILSHDGFQLVSLQESAGIDRGVWVSDLSGSVDLDTLRSFVEAGERRWAVVLGHTELDLGHPRLIDGRTVDDIPALRAALEFPHEGSADNSIEVRDVHD